MIESVISRTYDVEVGGLGTIRRRPPMVQVALPFVASRTSCQYPRAKCAKRPSALATGLHPHKGDR